MTRFERRSYIPNFKKWSSSNAKLVNTACVCGPDQIAYATRRIVAEHTSKQSAIMDEAQLLRVATHSKANP